MDNLKSKYEEIINSSAEYLDTEDVVPEEANFDKSIKKEINSYQDIFKDVDGLRRALSKNSNKWKNIGLHIAVTGSSGAGKSSFINAIRNVCADDEGGAEVGVTETTTELTPFTHPNNPNFIVWDMPGVGTPKFPRYKYLECVEFDRYDFFMILSKSRFTEDDLWLAKEIQKRGKRFYFIRTNIDSEIYNEERSHKKNPLSPQKVMDKIFQECQNNLQAAGFEKPIVYLVDNLDRKVYDFGKLELQLVQDSDNLKMESMALSLSVLSQEILQKKKEILEERIKDKAMEIASLDDYEEQRTIFMEEMSLYRKQFSIDEKAWILDGNKDILSLSEENLKEFRSFVKEKYIPSLSSVRLSHVSVFYKIVCFLRRMLDGIPHESYSEDVLQFSCIALHQNLEEVHRIALKVYNLDAQKVLVKSVWSS